MIGAQDNEANLLTREAHRWVSQLVSGEATLADAEALGQWRAQSAQHEAAFAEAVHRWNGFGAAGRELRIDGALAPWSPAQRLDRRVVLAGTGAFAAAAAGYALVSPPFGLWPSLDELRADYRTATGQQRQLTLMDHVTVRMNTQTSLAIPPAVNGADRVTVIAGEASFALSSGSSRPLIVSAGDGRTLARRARFDVRNIGAAVCVTCLEGDIRVEQGPQAMNIGAGRQLRYDSRGLGDTSEIDPAEAAAWQDGVLIFRLTPLTDVIAEINRYRPGRIILLNAALAQKPVSGRFLIRRIDDVLVSIEQAFGAKPQTLPGGILLLT